MNKLHFIFLSLISYIFLSGFLFEERGMSMPAPEKKPNTQQDVNGDFPLIKIKAFPSDKEKKVNRTLKTKKDNTVPRHKRDNNTRNTNNVFSSFFQSIVNVFSSKKQNKNIENTTIDSTNRVKSKNTKERKKKKEEVQPIQISAKHKSKNKRSKRRQTGHINKLIFNKNTSLKDIPLPLPSLKSLKLKSLIKSLPTIPVSKVPILNSIFTQSSNKARRRLRNQQNSLHNDNPTQTTNSNNSSLDMANIRIGKSDDYTTLIFDSYKWQGFNKESTVTAKESGNYEFEYEPKRNRIVAVIHGYTSFSALLGNQSKLFRESDVIKNIYIDRYIGNDSIKFIIQLKKPIQMTVLNMKNPGRIIVNLYPQ